MQVSINQPLSFFSESDNGDNSQRSDIETPTAS